MDVPAEEVTVEETVPVMEETPAEEEIPAVEETPAEEEVPAVEEPETPVEEDPEAPVYTLTFSAENGTVKADDGTTAQTIYQSSTETIVGVEAVPVSDEYEFAGWYKDGLLIDSDSVRIEAINLAAANAVYTAVFKQKTLDTGEDDEADAPAPKPALQAAPAAPALLGAGEGEANEAETFTVSFYDHEGELITELSVEAGGTIASFPDPAARNGFDFRGWYSDGGSKVTEDTVINESIAVYAKYETTVHFYVNDDLISIVSVDENDKIGAEFIPDDPEAPEGMYFEGWFDQNYNEVTGNTTVDEPLVARAEFAELDESCTVFFVRYDSDVSEAAERKGTCGTAIGVLPASERGEGYVFDGWYTESGNKVDNDTIINSNTVVEERFNVEIKFLVDGAEYAVIYPGEGYQLTHYPDMFPADPVKEGYDFAGWFAGDTEITNMTVADAPITAEARFTEKAPVYTVTFTNDGETVATAEVTEGETIGAQMPADPTPEEGFAFTGWFSGETQITADTVVTAAITAEARFEEVINTVTFTNGENVTTVQVPTGTTIGSLMPEDPDAPEKQQFVGWFSRETQITASTVVNEDISAEARFEQAYVTVTFYNGEVEYVTRDVVKGSALGTLPNSPVATGKRFNGWVIGETAVTAETIINEDTRIDADFTELTVLRFVMNNGTEDELVQYLEVEAETPVGTLPEAPYKDGYEFVRWYNQDNPSETVTAETLIPEGGLTAVAEFKEIKIYNVRVNYYYEIDSKVEFDHDVFDITEDDFDAEGNYTITVPASTQVSPDHDPEEPIYYPSEPQVVITLADLPTDTTEIVREVEYVSHTATYRFVYLLKDLEGGGYTEIERSDIIEGVLGSHVTPDVINYPYADFERLESTVITQAEGQELNVYYTRKTFRLSYYTDGGSFIESTDALYGETVNVTTEEPTRTGYEFAGWYLDEELTEPAGTTITLKDDTTLYAKWEGADVAYTIVYMKEKYEGGAFSFVYDNSRDGTGKVGETVVATSAPDLTNNIDGYEKDAERNAASSVVIKADGSSVLTVYYKLIRYTLVFNANQGTINIGGQTYTGSSYRIENVVLGQDIGSLWPSSSGEIYRNNWYFDGWDGAEADYITKQYELVWNHVANANSSHVMTYTAQWEYSSYNRDAEYWLQNADGTWSVYDPYTQTGLNTNRLSAKEIDGYTKHGGDGRAPSGYQGSGDTTTEEEVWVDEFDDTYKDDGGHRNANPGGNDRTITRDGHTYVFDHSERYTNWLGQTRYYYHYTCHEDGHYETHVVTVYTYRFYYDRAQYTITFNNGEVKETTDPIYFEADVSEYNNYVPDRPAGKEDYEWGGWFENAELTDPYTFSTMPGNKLAVYAKWIAPQFNVTYELHGGTADFETSLTVDKNSRVDFPGTPTRDGYEFAGWWTAAENGALYDWNAPIVEDTVIHAQWKQATLSYTVHYYEEGTTTKLLADKVAKNPAYVIGDEITEKALSVSGYRPDESSKTITLAADNNVITFYYSKKSDTTTYTVEYVLEDNHDIHVRASQTIEVDGSTVSVKESAHDVDEAYIQATYPDQAAAILAETYHPTRATQELVLTSDANKNVITFYYASYKTAHITVNYLDMDGNRIYPSVEHTVKVNASFTAETYNFSGWVLHHNDGELQFKVEDTTPKTISFYYQKKLSLVAANKAKSYDGEPLVSSGTEDLVQNYASVLEHGDRLTGISYDGSQTEGGSSSTTPRDAVIVKADGTPVNPDYYLISYVAGRLTVNQMTVMVIINADRWDGPVYDGTPKTFGFRNEGVDGVEINNELYSAKYMQDIRDMVKVISHTYTDAGTYTIPVSEIRSHITLPNDPSFKVTLNIRAGLLRIKKAPLTVTTGSAEKKFDGTPLTKTDEASIEGLVNGETAELNVTGSQTEPGSSRNTYEITWGTAKLNNYEITQNLGTLTVTINDTEVTLTAPSATKTYDGTPLTADGTGEEKVTAAGLPEGFTVEAMAFGEQTDAGSSDNFVEDGWIIRDADGNDRTELFTNVTRVPGTLTVEKAEVTVITGSDEKEYDGTALTNAEANITGLVNGETAAVTATGTQTEVGSSSNTYSITWGTANKNNYTIKEELGTLRVIENATEITVVPGSGEKTYDGTPLTKNEHDDFTVIGLPDGFTWTAAADGTVTNVSESPAENAVTEFHIFNAAGTDVTANFTNIDTSATGTLTIIKAKITLTGSTTVPYTGAEQKLELDPTKATGLVAGETLGFERTPTVKGTNAGTYTDVDYGTWFVTKANDDDSTGNYEIEVTATLVIEPIEVTVTITGANNTTDYDGNAHTVSGYTATANTDLYNVDNDFTFDGEATATRTDAGTTNMGLTPEQFTNINTNFGTVTFKIVDGYQTINPIDITVTITGHHETFTYAGTEHTVTGYDFSAGTELYTETDFTFSGNAEAKRIDVGTTNMNLAADQFANINGNFSTVTFEVTDGYVAVEKAEVTVTTGSDEKEYDGTALTNAEANITGLVNGETAIVTATGTQTEVGSSSNTYSITWGTANKDNYTIKEELGTLRVIENATEIKVVPGSGEKTYDGTPLTKNEHDDFTVTGLPEGFTWTAAADGTVTNVSESPAENSVTEFHIFNAAGTDVTANFTNINTSESGTLTINKAKITLTGSTTVPYTGAEQKLELDATKATGVVAGETLGFQRTPTVKGTNAGTYTDVDYGTWFVTKANDDDSTGNYEIEVTGTLVIEPIEVTVTITGANNTTDYDGEEHSVSGYTAVADNDLYNVETDFTFSGNAAAARTDAGTTNMNLAADQFVNTNKNFKNVTFNVTDGYQTINPIDVTVTITGHHETYPYDGTEHTVTGYDFEADTDLYTEADFTFSGTAEATRTNEGTTNMGLAQSQFTNTNNNFKTVTFNVTDGYVTIEKVDVVVTITGHNNTTDYDGEEHTVTGYDVEISNPLYTEADFTFSGKAEAKRTDVGTTNMGLAQSQFTNNNTNFTVTFDVTDGYQKIDPIDVTVTITGVYDTSDYDGILHVVEGYTAEASTDLYDVENDFSFTGEATAQRIDVGTSYMGLTADQFRNINPNFGTVTFEVTDGYQTINPIDVTVTITGKTSSVDYDGNEHEVNGYDVTISNPLYKEADFTFNGTSVAK